MGPYQQRQGEAHCFPGKRVPESLTSELTGTSSLQHSGDMTPPIKPTQAEPASGGTNRDASAPGW